MIVDTPWSKRRVFKEMRETKENLDLLTVHIILITA